MTMTKADATWVRKTAAEVETVLDSQLPPQPQDLPSCYRYPLMECPGECQYILRADECIWELGPGRRGP